MKKNNPNSSLVFWETAKGYLYHYPVSYTHLDVYKRQTLAFVIDLRGRKIIGVEADQDPFLH